MQCSAHDDNNIKKRVNKSGQKKKDRHGETGRRRGGGALLGKMIIIAAKALSRSPGLLYTAKNSECVQIKV